MSSTPSGPITATDADPTGQSAISARRSMGGPLVCRADRRRWSTAPRPGECASIAGVTTGPIHRLVDDTYDGRADPLLDSALGPALLHRVAENGGPELLRLYRPRPTLAFSGRDCASPGIGRGGRGRHERPGSSRSAVGRAAAPPPTTGARCVWITSARIADGIATRSGPRFAGYRRTAGRCAARSRGRRQAGSGAGGVLPRRVQHQRRARAQAGRHGAAAGPRGWLFGTVILVADPEPVREVLIEVYDALGLDWDPTTVGAVQTTAPVCRSMTSGRRCCGPTASWPPCGRSGLDDAGDRTRLRGRVDRHRVPRVSRVDRAFRIG